MNAAKQLELISRKRLAWSIEIDRKAHLLRLAKSSPNSGGADDVRFNVVENNRRGYHLSIARFPDGTAAWLDGRGLLHLQSSDPALPEVTLVLSETSLAAWLSDGRPCGPAYFLGQPDSMSATDLYDQVLVPLIDRIIA